MVRPLRILYRLSAIFIYTILTHGIYLIGYLLRNLFNKPTASWRNRFMLVWSRGMSRILSMQTKVVGTPPEPPFFLVSNHLGYIDIVPLFLHLDCTFVAKKEVRSWPALGFMVMTTGVIFVDRTRRSDVVRVNEIISRSLNKHQGVVMFPEGTTSGGKSVLPFHPSLLQFPATTGRPVHYCSLRYETDRDSGDLPAEESVCFYGARQSLPKHLMKLAGNRRIYCTLRFGEATVRNNDRKELARELQQSVLSIFEPMTE